MRNLLLTLPLLGLLACSGQDGSPKSQAPLTTCEADHAQCLDTRAGFACEACVGSCKAESLEGRECAKVTACETSATEPCKCVLDACPEGLLCDQCPRHCGESDERCVKPQ